MTPVKNNQLCFVCVNSRAGPGSSPICGFSQISKNGGTDHCRFWHMPVHTSLPHMLFCKYERTIFGIISLVYFISQPSSRWAPNFARCMVGRGFEAPSNSAPRLARDTQQAAFGGDSKGFGTRGRLILPGDLTLNTFD